MAKKKKRKKYTTYTNRKCTKEVTATYTINMMHENEKVSTFSTFSLLPGGFSFFLSRNRYYKRIINRNGVINLKK